MSPPDTSPSFLDRLRRFDPTVLPIVVAALVLVGAVLWLLGRPLPPPLAAGPDPQTAQQLESLRSGLAQLQARPAPAAPDLAPLRDAAQAANARAEAAERQAAALEQRLAALAQEMAARPAFDPAALDTRLDALSARAESLAGDLAARPALDPATLAQRGAVEQLGTRLDQLSARAEALARDLAARPNIDPATLAQRGAVEQLGTRLDQLSAQGQQRQATTDQAIAAAAGRIGAAEASLAARAQATEAQAARIGALEAALAARLTAAEGQIAQRAQAAEQLAGRVASLEGLAQRLAALEGRAARLAAIDAARTALEAGRPLGQVPDAPAPLARFATAAPPTEAALRLDFDAAARAALAASEPPAGAGVLDSAVSRLSGLVTVRRGEEVLWGDAAAAEVEKARRALEAGDLEGALRHLSRLSAPARAAMADWIGRAEALVAARAALRQMAAG
jgi:hypothetical protein